jgi:hypothetical protein
LPVNGQAWVFVPTETEYGAENALAANAQDMFDGASHDPTVVGMIGFVWTNAILCPPADRTHVFTTKELPTLLAKMRCISHFDMNCRWMSYELQKLPPSSPRLTRCARRSMMPSKPR